MRSDLPRGSRAAFAPIPWIDYPLVYWENAQQYGIVEAVLIGLVVESWHWEQERKPKGQQEEMTSDSRVVLGHSRALQGRVVEDLAQAEQRLEAAGILIVGVGADGRKQYGLDLEKLHVEQEEP